VKIVLYSTGCPKCQILKQALDNLNLKYEINGSVTDMLARGFTNAPMLDVDGEVLNYEKALERAERTNHEKQ